MSRARSHVFSFFAPRLLPPIRSSYQRPPHFRGRGNLLAIVETLAARLLLYRAAQPRCFKLWPSVPFGLCLSFSAQSSSGSSSAELSITPQERSRARRILYLLPLVLLPLILLQQILQFAAAIASIVAILQHRTGISADARCRLVNRRRRYGCGRTGRKYQ